ncbi:MAG: pitrilysin family protein [bacterium]
MAGIPCILACLLLLTGSSVAGDVPVLPLETHTLPNGLQVILQPDPACDVVAVNIRYHSGSGAEDPGQHGLAHLFEHLMFKGSEHHDRDYFQTIQEAGGEVNAQTNRDRTTFWETIAPEQLERVLWLEADRMGRLLPALTPEKFDRQKEVVIRELAQRADEPYGGGADLLAGLVHPPEHPYSWPVGGDPGDLPALTLEDAQAFHRTHYVPNNASLCIVGAFDPGLALEWVKRYFGPLEPGPRRARLRSWPVTLAGERRLVVSEAKGLGRIAMAWPSPGWFRPGDGELDLLADVLAQGRSSRLTRRLVHELKTAQKVAVRQESRELGGMFVVEITAAPGADLGALEAAADQVLAILLKDGITPEELRGAVNRRHADLLRRLEIPGGTSGRAHILNRYLAHTGRADYIGRDLERYLGATAEGVSAWARRCLSLEDRAVLVHLPAAPPVPQLDAEGVPDTMPPVGPGTPYSPPLLEQGVLDNGMKVFLVRRPGLPLVEVHLNVQTGWAADPAGRPGTATLTAAMLDEGAGDLSGQEIAARFEALGAEFRTTSSFDGVTLSLNILAGRLDEGLDLLQELVRRPRFDSREFADLKGRYRGRQTQEAADAAIRGIVEVQELVFGPDHPYGLPYTGSGTPAGLEALTVDDLRDFHRRWYRPGNVAVVLVGDLDPAEALARCERAFGNWKAAATPAPPALPAAAPHPGGVVLFDHPGEKQATLVAGCLTVPRSHSDYRALQLVNLVFGGQYASRINLNLREDRGLTYGVRSRLLGFRGAGLFLITAQVPVDRVPEAMRELDRELRELRTTRPLTADELEMGRARLQAGFTRSFGTMRRVADNVDHLLENALPLDAWAATLGEIAGIDAATAAGVVERHLDPDGLVWVVLGPAADVEEGFRAAGMTDWERGDSP